MDTRKIFDDVKRLQDIVDLASNTTDGESNSLEFKSVHQDLWKASKSDIGDFKLTLAKEMSAFANTDSGILIIGFDGKKQKIDNATPKLEEWLDRHVGSMLEPQLPGVIFHTISDASNGEVVILYVPKCNAIPYRVASVGSYSKKSLVREYYQRVGTNSMPMAEAIVRGLYRSNDRSIDLEVYPEIVGMRATSSDRRGIIRLGLKVKTDPSRLITKYYLDTEAYILDSRLKPFRGIPFSIHSSTLKDQPIPPSGEIFELDTFDIRSKTDKGGDAMYGGPLDYDNMDTGNTETITESMFNGAYALYIITRFACDGMPMKTDKRLIIFGHDRTTGVGKIPLDSSSFGKCKVVSWLSVDDDLHNKIAGFMHDNGLELE